MSKLYPAVSPGACPECSEGARHLGRAQSRAGDSPRSQRHDTPSIRLRAAPLWGRTRLRDALVVALPRILRLGFAHGLQASPCGTGQVPRISRSGKDNSSNSTEGSWQKSEDLWALKDVSFEACPEPNRRVKQGEVVGTLALRARCHRPQRRGEIDPAQDPLAHHRADQRPRRDLRRPRRQPTGRCARRRLAERTRANPRRIRTCGLADAVLTTIARSTTMPGAGSSAFPTEMHV